MITGISQLVVDPTDPFLEGYVLADTWGSVEWHACYSTRAMGTPLYDRLGTTYTATRREDPELAGQIHTALGDGRTLLNVGAGAGVRAARPHGARGRAVAGDDRAAASGRRLAVLAAAERLPFAPAASMPRWHCIRCITGTTRPPVWASCGGSPAGWSWLRATQR